MGLPGFRSGDVLQSPVARVCVFSFPAFELGGRFGDGSSLRRGLAAGGGAVAVRPLSAIRAASCTWPRRLPVVHWHRPSPFRESRSSRVHPCHTGSVDIMQVPPRPSLRLPRRTSMRHGGVLNFGFAAWAAGCGGFTGPGAGVCGLLPFLPFLLNVAVRRRRLRHTGVVLRVLHRLGSRPGDDPTFADGTLPNSGPSVRNHPAVPASQRGHWFRCRHPARRHGTAAFAFLTPAKIDFRHRHRVLLRRQTSPWKTLVWHGGLWAAVAAILFSCPFLSLRFAGLYCGSCRRSGSAACSCRCRADRQTTYARHWRQPLVSYVLQNTFTHPRVGNKMSVRMRMQSSGNGPPR